MSARAAPPAGPARGPALLAALALSGVCALANPGCGATPRPPPPTLDATRSLDEVFLSLPGGGGPVELKPLTRNTESFAERWAAVSSAKRTLDVATFILDDDVVGLAFLGLLRKKAREGVKVRLMFDARGTSGHSLSLFFDSKLGDLTALENIEVRETGPLVPRFFQAVADLDISPMIASNHDKLIIVDGQEVICGGRNIGHHYMVSVLDEPRSYSDVDFNVRGEATVLGLQRAFDLEWYEAVPWPPSAEPESPLQPSDVDLVGRAMQMWIEQPPLPDGSASALRVDGPAREKAEAELLQWMVERAGPIPPLSRVQSALAGSARELVGYPSLRGHARRSPDPWIAAEARVIDSRTRADRQVMDGANELLIELIGATQREIVVLNPYILLTKRGYDVLKQTCARGVEITFFTNSPVSSDSVFTQALFLRMWPEILAGCPGARMFVLGDGRPLHGKVAVLDEHITLMGSYNVDYISAYLNGEIGLALRGRDLALEMKRRILERVKQGPPVVFEYRIERDGDGNAARYPAGHARAGTPVIVFGPEDHVPAATLAKLQALQAVVDNTPGVFAVPLM